MSQANHHNDLDLVKQMLQQRIVDVVAKLLPRGRREGRQWVAYNPHVIDDHVSAHGGKRGPALKVAIASERGAWTDWRNGRMGYKGDIFGLIMFVNNCDLREALSWSRDFLGIQQMSPADRTRLKQQAATAAKKRAAEDAEARISKIVRAAQLWERDTFATRAMSGPELHARAYFAGRNCPLEALGDALPQETFRFAPATEWWKGAKWQPGPHGGSRKAAEGPRFPAIHTAMRSVSGALACCHVTYLDPLLPKKAPVEPPKLMFGEALGAVIEVSLGPSGQPFWQPDAPPGPLILCEGIETGLSLAVAVPEARVWAGGSLAGMGHAPVQVPCVADVTVARDNNLGNPQAQKQLAQALARLEEAQKRLSVIESHVGDDFNDLMTGEDDG